MESSLGDLIISRLSEVYSIKKDEFAPLNFKDPFLIIVSIILSQNTTDKNALKAMENLVYNGLEKPEDFLKAGREKIKDMIRVAGLYDQKAEAIIRLAKWSVQKYGGDLSLLKNEDPDQVFNELTSIKGIGPKTADVFLVFYLRARTFPIDTHIRRVVKRLGIADGSYDKMKKRLLEIFPDPMKAHILLIKHGRTTCRAKNPNCEKCVLNDVCRYHLTLKTEKKA
ncbi:MAG: endonuclease III [Conexivisphaerales archaeon]|nr:endonuclease III [Conexivisphaerales archaeon]